MDDEKSPPISIYHRTVTSLNQSPVVPCSFSGCGLPCECSGMCSGHYQQKRLGKPLRPLKSNGFPRTFCSFDGCGKRSSSGGLCSGHLEQKHKGQPLRRIGTLSPFEYEDYGEFIAAIIRNADGDIVARAIVDACDFLIVREYKWGIKSAKLPYVIARVPGERRKAVSMHRLITECPNDMEVDHRDGNPLNNRRGNLRIVTRAQNAQNVARKSRLGRNVYYDARRPRSPWFSMVQKDRKRIYGGFFSTQQDALKSARELRERLLENCNNARH